jgi:hypothetical protein
LTVPDTAPEDGGVYESDTFPDAPAASVIDGALVVQPFAPREPQTPISVYVAVALPPFVRVNESACGTPFAALAAVDFGESLGMW